MINGLELLPLLTKLYRSAQKVIENFPLFHNYTSVSAIEEKKLYMIFYSGLITQSGFRS